MSKTVQELLDEYGYEMENKSYVSVDPDDFKSMLSELQYLQYFYSEVDSALGCASDDIYEMIKDDYDGEIPEGY